MIRKVKIFLFIFFAFIIFLLSNKVYAYINYSIGNNLYNKQEYQKARWHFKTAYHVIPENSNFKDKYIETLTKVPLDYYAQMELFNMLKDGNTSPALIEAYKRLEVFKDNVLTHFEDNYITACSYNSQIIRWDENKFPLKVYIKENENLDKAQKKIIKKSFEDWSKEFNDFFKFTFTDDEGNADILVNFDFSLDEEAAEDISYVIANTVPNIEGTTLKSMVISVNLFDRFGEKVPNEQLYTTLLHEIGHALGIMGHSTDFHDLMYVGDSGQFTKRDINTMKLLYLLMPDISNSNLRTMPTDRKIYAPIVIGETFAQDQELFTKAKTYINRSPDLSLGWSQLGEYYYRTKDYPKAIKSYLKAKSLSRNDTEKKMINANLGLIYVSIKDYKNAVFYLREAQKFGMDAETGALLGFTLIQLDRKAEGVDIMENAFQAQPSNMNIGFMLADYYCSEMKFGNAVRVLKLLKKNNPNYMYNPERWKYKILNLFVNSSPQNTQYRV